MTTASFAAGQPNVQTVPAQLFMSQVNVPTETFTEGFRDGSGNVLKDNAGQSLIEYFSVHLQSEIMLNVGESEGDYQFAIMSDDGSIMQIDAAGTGSYAKLVVNDGQRANTLGCASTTTHLVPGVPLPIKLDYFQGPRYSISFILLWRKSPASLSDKECGVVEGDDYFFDESVFPSQAKSPYTSLKARGWTEVPATNFFLPGTITNPCK